MRLDDVTPIILTYNEEPNIGRALDRLSWARNVVVIDSFSTDRTPEIVRGYGNARLIQHPFSDHAAQWTFAVNESGIASEWVLILDSDFIVPADFADELSRLEPASGTEAYETRFRYCIYGRPLRRSIFPPRIVLCRRRNVSFLQDGHAHRVAVSGETRRLKSAIDHDDRKPLSHWVGAQVAYAKMEREKLRAAGHGSLDRADRIRALGFVAPIAVLGYCLFVKKLIFAGLPGWYYTYQRVMAEALLSLYLIEDRLSRRDLN